MPRPNMREQRRVEILDAYENCVARYGVEGATLEKIAEEAGLARALIRHNVGNKEDLIAALVDRFFKKSNISMRELIESLPSKNRSRTLIDWLFDPTYSDPKLVLVTEALLAAAANDPALAKRMRRWTNDFVKTIETEVRKEHSAADDATLDAVAAGISGLYFNIDSFALLGPMKKLRENSKQAAVLLLEALEKSK